MRDETWDHHEIERPIAEYLVGDVDAVVRLGVMSHWHCVHVNI